MALAYVTPGIVLGYRSVREADRMYRVLTPGRGKIELIARGSRKVTSKLAGTLEPLQLIMVEAVVGRQFDHVVGANRLAGVPAFPIEPSARLLALGLATFLDAAVKPAAPDQRIFSLFRECMDAVGSASSALLLLRDAFLWKCAVILGLAADPTRCIACGRAEGLVALSGSLGGFLCAVHPAPPDAAPLTPAALLFLRAAHALPLSAAMRLPLSGEDVRIVHRAVGLYALYQFSGTVDPAMLLRLFGDVALAPMSPIRQ